MFVTLESLEKAIPVLEESDKALSGAVARDAIMNAQTNLFFQMGLQNPDIARAGMAAVNPLLGHLNSNMLDVISGYQSGKLNFPTALKRWQEFTRDSYKKLFLAGTKASGNPYYNKLGLTRKDLAFIDKAIRYESRFFKKFLFDIKDPKHLPASQIPRDASGKMLPGYRPQKFDYLKRASMYAQTGKAQVFNGMIAGSPQELIDIYWVLGTPQTESCSDCIRLARRKWTWKTLPTTPRAGDTACKWKCYCRLEIRPKKAGPKMTVPGRATAGALMTAGRHARVYNAQGMEMTGTIQAEVEAIYAQMYKARQMMRITADAERMEWIMWRKALNRQLIDRLQTRGYRTTPTISVRALLKTVDSAKAAGGKRLFFADVGDEIILIRGDFSSRGIVRMVGNKLVFRNATGVDLIITNETDIMFLLQKEGKWKSLSTGTFTGSEKESLQFAKGSKLRDVFYHGTRDPKGISASGFRPLGDEVNWHPGVSFTDDINYARDYTGGEGEILAVRLRIVNPVKYGDLKVVPTSAEIKKYGDIGSFYAAAERQGFDAVVGPSEVRIFDSSQVFLVGQVKVGT